MRDGNMTVMTLYPFYDYHDSPITHRELRNFFEAPPAGNYVSRSCSEYDVPSRHGARYWKVNLADGSMTEILSNGYNLYYQRSSGSGAVIGNFSVNVPSEITFGNKETFAVTFWVGVYCAGSWRITESYPASPYDRFVGVYESAGSLTEVEKLNPCTFTQYVFTLRDIIESPPRTTAYTYFYYPSSRELLQSRLFNIDLELKAVVPVAKRIYGDGLVWIYV